MTIAQDLAAHTTGVVKQTLRGTSIWWKVRKLTPVQLGQSPQMMRSMLLFITASVAEIEAAKEQQRDVNLPDVPSTEDQERFAVNLERIIGLAVVGVSRDGEAFEAITLVPPEQEDGEAGRISVATIDTQTATLVMAVAFSGAMEAGDLIRPFRPGRHGDGADARLDGEEVRAPAP